MTAVGALWRSRAVLVVLPLLVSVIPVVLIVLSIQRAGARVPVESHWDMVPLVERAVAGTLGFGDLWAQNNEHRPVVAWVFMLALAWFTRWNVQTELFLNVAFSLAAVGVLAALIYRLTRRTGRALAPWLVLASSLMTFSQVKWENWLLGLSQAAFLGALAACLTVFLIAWRGPTLAGTVLATLAGIFGVLSFANGLVLLLGIVPIGLALDPRGPARRRLALAAAALAAGIATTAVYLVGFQYPSKHPNPWLLFERFPAFVGYVLAYVGAPLGWPDVTWSIAWGAAGVAGLGAAAAWLWVRDPVSRADVLPWVLLALWVVGSAAMVGVGRLGFGVDQALSSRYTTMSTFFWVSVAVVVGFATALRLDRPSASPRAATALLAVVVLGIVVGAGSYATAWLRAEPWVDSAERASRYALECVRFYREAPDGCLALTQRDPAYVRRAAEWLDRVGLGPFAVRSERPTLASYTVVRTPQPAGAIAVARARPILGFVGAEKRYASTEIELAGWAMDPMTRKPASSVLVVAHDQVLDRVSVEAGGSERAVWSYRFHGFRLPKAARTIEAYAVLDGGRIVRLQGTPPVDGVLR